MNEDQFAKTINYLNSLSLANHFAKTLISFSILFIFISFFAPVTYSSIITTLYFCIGFNIALSFITLTPIYYCRAALGQCLVGLALSILHLFQ